ncbi:MAG TPA: hypothetical protein VFI96_08770 [Longimicrobiaceae bacterium]|nr:hypothetical protein [Longimicrobiaceae bacterium]
MKRPFVLPSLLLLLVAAACGEPKVTVEAALPGVGGAPAGPVADLPIRLLPYDRAAILDSLRAAAETPEPAPDSTLALLQQQMDSLEAAWRAARTRARQIDDSLQVLTGSGERERLDRERGEVKQRADSAFARLTRLRRAVGPRADSLRRARRAWAAAVFQPLDSIARERAQERGHAEVVDTTRQAGQVVFRIPEGQWWVFSRYAVTPDEELVWNLPVTVTAEGAHVRLTQENAERQPIP